MFIYIYSDYIYFSLDFIFRSYDLLFIIPNCNFWGPELLPL